VIRRARSACTLRRLDSAAYHDHYFLAADDACWYLGEYRCGGRGGGVLGDLGDLVRQLKWGGACQEAVRALAELLRAGVERAWVESATWVPIPPSQPQHDPDADVLTTILRQAFADYDLDVRGVLRQRTPRVPDRRLRARARFHTLYESLCVEDVALSATAPRERIVLFDDVLTSGKHYQCARQRILETDAKVPVCGVFLTRRVPRSELGRMLPREVAQCTVAAHEAAPAHAGGAATECSSPIVAA
jgi:predicted amidophosphoribosyltransferase